MIEPALPVDDYVDAVRAALAARRAVVVVAEPGAGKTTRIPPVLAAGGATILLQPRRVAARSIAARIAAERGWTLGGEVGWHVRFERRFSARTRLVVATEGILTARLQADPLLSDFRTIVLDEFHERSVHADLAIALARQAWRARDDLRIVVMSATLDAEPVAAFLDGCPIVRVPGRLHPVDTRYLPGRRVVEGALEAMAATAGDVLCFLPGAFEIRQAMAAMAVAPGRAPGLDLLPLHGSLDAAEQDRALQTSSARRVIFATNIAETSITVPGVTAVVDAGLQKVARYDAGRGVDSLDLERIPQDSADQRAGRAGRVGPGLALRLWDERDRLRPHREPEIRRVDLAGVLLAVIAWGGNPRTFEWFEPPRADAADASLALLERLGLAHAGRITDRGRTAAALPVHPRLAAMLAASGGARDIARISALLSERHVLPARSAATTSDLLSALDRWETLPPHVQRAAVDVERACASQGMRPAAGRLPDEELRHLVLTGYPDRVAQRRQPGAARVLLASGTGAVVAPESGVISGEFLVALDVRESGRPGDPEARIRLASQVERAWLAPTAAEIAHRFDEGRGVVRAVERSQYDALVLGERPVAPDPSIAAPLLAAAWLRRGPGPGDLRLLRRARFAGHTPDVESIVHAAASTARSVDEIRLEPALPAAIRSAIDRDAPDRLRLPGGRTVALEYGDDGSVSASVRLQDLFGVDETPRIGPRREPVLLALLAPNGRPVQLTRDLRSFWSRTYPEVRKELRGRYPKHRWPENPESER
ncbi:MAG TPA: ATP-dependent helicase C-terminal domain-containing protein [Vicinamibacterales bacterium]|nr:ATP-dependent helicase C-terminal domain-containing protein [Vicinamibacterales bacterium]